MSLLVGKKKKSEIVVHNKYKYYICTSNKNTAYCALRYKKCHAKVNLVQGKWVEYINNVHNHEQPTVDYEAVKDAENEVFLLCRNTSDSFQSIVNDVCKR